MNIEYVFCCLFSKEYFSKNLVYNSNDINKNTLENKILLNAYSKIKKHNYKVNFYPSRIVCTNDEYPLVNTDEVICTYFIEKGLYLVNDRMLDIDYNGRCVHVFMSKCI
jgi:hypothetical protein